MIKFSQNCGNDRYGVCSNAIPRLNRIFFTRAPTPVAPRGKSRDFTPPSGGGGQSRRPLKPDQRGVPCVVVAFGVDR